MVVRNAFSVAIFARNPSGEILLVQHRRLNRWLPVGGEIEAGETPLQAARRELREETGFTDAVFSPVTAVATPSLVPVDGSPAGLFAYEEHDAGSKGLHMNFCFVADVVGLPAPCDEWAEARFVTDTAGLDCPPNVHDLVARLRTPSPAALARAWITAFNAHDLDTLLALYHPNAVHVSPKLRDRQPQTRGEIRGHEALRAWWHDAMVRIPDLHYEERAITAAGDRVFLEYVRHAPGEPDMDVAELYLVSAGKIASSRVFHG